MLLFFLASLIIDPKGLGAPYVFLLTFLRPATKQDNQMPAVPAEVNSITRSEAPSVRLIRKAALPLKISCYTF